MTPLEKHLTEECDRWEKMTKHWQMMAKEWEKSYRNLKFQSAKNPTIFDKIRFLLTNRSPKR